MPQCPTFGLPCDL